MTRENPPIPLRRLFGSVVEAALPEGPSLLLSNSRIPLQPILDLLQQGADDQAIYKNYRDISRMEIQSAKLYYMRFGTDAAAPASLPAEGKALLLDECIPIGLTALANELFGFSTHVELEGLSLKCPGEKIKAIRRQDVDSVIAKFAYDERFGGLLTRDHDFLALSRNPEHPASKITIFVLPGHITGEKLEKRFEKNKFAMHHAMTSGSPRLYIFP